MGGESLGCEGRGRPGFVFVPMIGDEAGNTHANRVLTQHGASGRARVAAEMPKELRGEARRGGKDLPAITCCHVEA